MRNHFRKFIANLLLLLLTISNAHANENKNGIAEFLSGIDSMINTLCDSVAPTTNDTVTGKKL